MITSLATSRSGGTTMVTVVSSLSGVVYYHWYLDGSYVGATTSPAKGFFSSPGDQQRIDVLDSNDAAFDPFANAPPGFPSRRNLVFVRSLDANIAKYRVEQQRGADAWAPIATVLDDYRAWSFAVLTPRLDDLTSYAWRVIPVDVAGNDGTPISLGAELVVRTPDSPDFEIAFDQDTTKVTFTGVS